MAVLTIVVILYYKGFLKAKLKNCCTDTAPLALPQPGFTGALFLQESRRHLTTSPIWPQARISEVYVENIMIWAGYIYIYFYGVTLQKPRMASPVPLNPVPDTESLKQ